MQRGPSPADRRVLLLTLTDKGQALLAAAVPSMLCTLERILEPLAPGERDEFVRMLHVMGEANNELSRAPREGT